MDFTVPPNKLQSISTIEPPPPIQEHWMTILELIAKEKRQTIPRAIAAYWRAKLEKFPDSEVTEFILETPWRYLPQADEVFLGLLEKRERLAAQREQDKHKQWLAEQEAARIDGRAATQADYDRLKKQLRERVFSPSWGRRKPKASTSEIPNQEKSRRRGND